MGKPYPSYQPTRCTAHRKSDGEPCGNWAIRGANVCRKHGGSAGQVKRRAAERLNEASYALAGMLLDIATSGTSESVRLAAIRDALDRAGLNAKTEVSIEVAPWLQAIDSIVIDSSAPDSRPEVDALVAEWNATADCSDLPHEDLDVIDGEVIEDSLDEPAQLSSRPPARIDPEQLGRRKTRPVRRK